MKEVMKAIVKSYGRAEGTKHQLLPRPDYRLHNGPEPIYLHESFSYNKALMLLMNIGETPSEIHT